MYIRHDVKDIYDCDKCELKFAQSNELRSHKHEIHGETYHGKKSEMTLIPDDTYAVEENIEIEQLDDCEEA